MNFDPDLAGSIISRTQPVLRDSFGPTVELLTGDDVPASAPALIRGTITPGITIPLHAHDDPETFYVLSGQIEGLVMTSSGASWITIEDGQIFHVPPGARHALRNAGSDPAVALIVSTPRMAGFFEEAGIPLDSLGAPRRPPSPAEVERMMKACAERGYWNASAQENAAVGIELPLLPET